MDGLECSEVALSQTILDNEKLRWDSGFFIKKYVYAYKKIKTMNHIQLKEIIEVLTDFHANGSYENIAKNFQLLDSEDYAYMVRSTDLENNNFSENIKYVSKHSYEFLSKSKIYGGELLINKIGTPGKVYLMPNLYRPVSLGMNLFMLRLKKSSPISETVLWLYFNTVMGQLIIKRKINGTVPFTIDKEAIRTLYVPVWSIIFQEALQRLVDKASTCNDKSKQIYLQGEHQLLDELNFVNFIPSEQNISIKSFSDSFAASSRLDAEYYQIKYDNMFAMLSTVKTFLLDNLVWIKKSVEPGSEEYRTEGIPFVRVSDLSKYGLSEPEIHLSRIRFAHMNLQPKKDTILLSKDGSVGIAYKVDKDLDIVTSGAILHLELKTNQFLPDYLTLVLNSMIVKMQAERDAGGSIIKHWKPSEIEKVVIPWLPIDKQEKISCKIQESFSLRRESKELLGKAKQAIEIAIENDEQTAMAWLSNLK